MASTTPLTDAINALTTYANEVTGAQDKDLSSAVATLAEGYGQGDETSAIVGSSTEFIKWTGGSSTSISRLFSRNPAKVIYLDGFTKMDLTYLFQLNANLRAAIFPDATSFVAYTFWETSTSYPSLGIDIYQQQSFPSAMPFRIEGVAHIILRNEVMSTIDFTASTWGVGSSTDFYVPSALLSDYLADSNWSTFGSSRILAIEGSEFEDKDWWKAYL